MSLSVVFLALLALAGGAFSFYFLQVYRGKLAPNTWWIPTICRIDSNSCRNITDTPYGSLMGKPNAFWGCIYYPTLFGAVVSMEILDAASWVTLYLSVASLAMTGYLVWGLIRLRVICRLCVAVHVVNVLVFLIQIVGRNFT
ncbi:MAG: vitamin K epoxide reductase family protein [Candidatus Neomarinimicrobiota bacterium]